MSESKWRRDFPGGPVVKTPHFQCRGRRFNPSVRELRSHMRKKKTELEWNEEDVYQPSLNTCNCQLKVHGRGEYFMFLSGS